MICERVSTPVAWHAMTRRLVPILAVVLLAAACSSSGEPNGFLEQPTAVGAELGAALGLSADATIPIVERNFLETCVIEGNPAVGVTAGALPAACQCTYDGLVGLYLGAAEAQAATDVERTAFESFKDLDSELEESGRPLPANVQTIIEGCTG